MLTMDMYLIPQALPAQNSDAEIRTWERLVSADVSRLTLAYSTYLLSTIPVMEARSPGLVSRYMLGPLCVLLGLAYLYALGALAIFISVSASKLTFDKGAGGINDENRGLRGGVDGPVPPASELALNAQLRVANPMSAVSALFPASRQADDRPWPWANETPKDLFVEKDPSEVGTGTGTPRLRMGLRGDSKGRPPYSVELI
jgi:hypothetical protein